MARGWTCARCANKNGEGTLNCAKCGLIRGGVVQELQPWGVDQAQPGWVLPSEAVGPSRPLWRRIPVRAWIVGVVLIAGGVSAFMTDAIRLPIGGDIAKSGELAIQDLAVGDCWDLIDRLAESFDTVIARPCAEAHEYELFHIGVMPTGAYPTEDAFLEFVDLDCVPPFTDYVGKVYADSELDIAWFSPTTGSWNAGDRSIQCAIEDPGNWRLIGSVKGSAR
jgi:hypothetical protein